MKQRIAIDMDEVIADMVAKHLAMYNRHFGQTLTKRDLHGVKLRKYVPAEQVPLLTDWLYADDFFRDLPVIPGSQEVVRALMERYDIFITTAAMEYPTSFPAKYAWLKEHFPFIPDSHLVFCGDKSIVHADFLIDDNARHFPGFAGKGILFSAPHNMRETAYTRVNDWQEVARLFLHDDPRRL